MSKASEKKERRDKILKANNEIYKSLVNYLVGPKWDHSWNKKNYQIGDTKSKSKAFGIIKVDTGYMSSFCSIYFSRDIDIYMTCRDHCHENKFSYQYFNCDSEYMNIPDDIDEYVFKTKTFLKELLRDVACKSMINYGCTDLRDLSECVDLKKPDGYNTVVTNFTILEQPYSYDYPEVIDYATAIMKSKKYKRFRGDNA